MSRAARLLDLLQLLRRRRTAVPGTELAAELGVSLRTLYRDIATLQAQGADIVGEAGLGYVLQLEALTLGMAWVADRGDGGMQTAAREVLAKLRAVIPVDLRAHLDCGTMLIGPGSWATADDRVYLLLRAAMHDEVTLIFTYQDQHGSTTRRTVWPCAIGLFDQVRMLIAWCELRGGFRHFRLDRIVHMEITTTRFPRQRAQLLREWRIAQGIPADGN
jgi:predicted DNA-binding transcriptional regulator YafY